MVAGFEDLNLGANTRVVEWSDKAVLFAEFFDRHRRLGPDHRVDAANCTYTTSSVAVSVSTFILVFVLTIQATR